VKSRLGIQKTYEALGAYYPRWDSVDLALLAIAMQAVASLKERHVVDLVVLERPRGAP
jgi:hypothetical protein